MQTLDDLMEPDHVIQVHENGSITEPKGIWAPEIYVTADKDGQILAADEKAMIEHVKSQNWELLTGYTGQQSYNGPLMHASEYIGGGLETAIRSTPGFYVALVVDILGDQDDDSEPVESVNAGWAVAYRAP